MKKLLTLLTLTFGFIVNANAFNTDGKVVQAIIPFAAGGGVDLTFKHFAKYAESKGINIIPVYKPGAEGVIGMNEISERPKDGLHISIGTAGTVAMQRIKSPQNELEIISMIRNSMMIFVASNKSGLTNFNDFETKLKTSSSLNLAYGAPGQKMLLDQLIEKVDSKFTSTLVPYKGGAPVLADLRGGHVDVGVLPLSIAKPHIESGDLKPLAITSKTKPSDLSKVISLPDRYSSWSNDDAFLFILPRGTDPEAVKFWTNILKQYMEDKHNIDFFLKEFTELSPFGKMQAEKSIENVRKQLIKIQ